MLTRTRGKERGKEMMKMKKKKENCLVSDLPHEHKKEKKISTAKAPKDPKHKSTYENTLTYRRSCF